MTSKVTHPVPTDLTLHKQTRILSVKFDNGTKFDLPCEYLRVFSPSAEVRTSREQGNLITGKEAVNIEAIKPVGDYAVRLVFDDGHDSGIFSWSLLYELGENFAANWEKYLQEAGYSRTALPDIPQETNITVNVLYFAWIAERLGRETETILLPRGKKTVAALLAQLRKRGGTWERGFSEPNVNITVNRQFAAPDTQLHENDEVGIVPTVPW